jgi:hypothetical protein
MVLPSNGIVLNDVTLELIIAMATQHLYNPCLSSGIFVTVGNIGYVDGRLHMLVHCT